MTPCLKTNKIGSLKASEKWVSSPVQDKKKDTVQNVYSKYLSDIKNKEETNLLPIPINEVSKTLSVDTFSIMSSWKFIETIKDTKTNKRSSKDRSTSVEEDESISVEFGNCDEYEKTEEHCRSKLGRFQKPKSPVLHFSSS